MAPILKRLLDMKIVKEGFMERMAFEAGHDELKSSVVYTIYKILMLQR